MKKHNTVFLRLEGPMQSWGGQESKFVIRRAGDAPTKSGVIGMIFAAMGISRTNANDWLPKFSELVMGVRIDRAGVRWWDYHTVGAKIGNPKAKGGIKKTGTTGELETLVSRREYICDGSFLVVLQGNPDLIEEISNALQNPVWTIYLGRKSCPPSVPVFQGTDYFNSVEEALYSQNWRPRNKGDKKPEFLDCFIEWQPTKEESFAPADAEVWYDVPDSFEWPSHHPRFVIKKRMESSKDFQIDKTPSQNKPKAPDRPRADYRNSKYKEVRKNRLDKDQHACVFCKSPATTVQHITYQRGGGNEEIDDLRALCRLCHDAVTMIEYGENMGMERINPVEKKWRDRIIEKRTEIIKHRSRAIRSRKLSEEDEE